MKMVYQYMPLFCIFSPTLNHLYPLQVGNCDGKLRVSSVYLRTLSLRINVHALINENRLF